LRDNARQHAAIAALGQSALSGTPLEELLDETVRLLRRIFRADFAKALALTPDARHLLVRAGIGWHQGVVPGESMVENDPQSQAGYTLASDAPVIVRDLSRERRFRGPQLLIDHGIVSGMSVVVGGRERPWGIIGVHTRRERRFTRGDANVLAGAAHILAMVIDRDAADRALRGFGDMIGLVTENMPVALAILDRDEHYRWANRRSAERAGRPLGSLIGRTVEEVQGPAYPAIRPWIERVLEGQPVRYERGSERTDGTRGDIEVFFTPMRDHSGNVEGFSSLVIDVTERKRVEAALRESRRMLERAQSAAHIGTWSTEGTGLEEMRWSGEMHRILGLPPDAFDGTLEGFFGLVHADDRDVVRAVFRDPFDRHTSLDLEFRIVRPDGMVRWVHVQGEFVRDPPMPPQMLGVCRDITERRIADRALHESEARNRFLARIVEQSDDAIFTRDLDDVITSWNHGAEKMFKYTAAQAIGRRGRDLHLEDLTDSEYEDFMTRVREGRAERFEARRRRFDGEIIWIHAVVAPLHDDAGRRVGELAISRDITNLKLAEQALRDSEDRYRRVVEATPNAIIVHQDGVITFVNEHACRLYGAVVREQLVGRPILSLIPEELRDTMSERIRLAAAWSTVPPMEQQVIRIDGSLVDVEATAIPFVDQGRPAVISVQQEITERKQAREGLKRVNDELEARVLERTAQLATAHREAESLSYTIAHDLRAPLRAISGYSRILIQDMARDLPVDAIGYLQRMDDNAVRMGGLIDALLSFGRLSRRPLVRVPVNMDVLARDVLTMLAAELAQRDVVILTGPLGEARADAGLLRTAFTNLVINAVKFTRDRAPGRIEIGSTVLEGERTWYVRDNGAGFDMQFADKLFGVFQRLHRQDEFEGSGVGLASVQRILHRHGGRVWATAESGKGATFFFTIGN
jgi:PAS domain S-box-containing protein